MVARLQKALKAEMERGEDDNADDGSVKGEDESEGMDVAQDEKKLEVLYINNSLNPQFIGRNFLR